MKNNTGVADRTKADRRAFPANKRLGQHFLEPAWAAKVVAAIAASPDQTILEIGPGRGAITERLTDTAGHVVAFELDRRLAHELVQRGIPTLRLVEGDFLDTTVASLRAVLPPAHGALRVAGNLPYNVAAPILFKLVELHAGGVPIVDAAVMLQREVANRLLAPPGNKDYGVLTILIGRHARVERLLNLPSGAFRPAPKVQSTVVRLIFHPPHPEVPDERFFTKLTQAIFTRRRKTIANALLALSDRPHEPPVAWLRRAGLDPGRRPETLSIDELARLAACAIVSPAI